MNFADLRRMGAPQEIATEAAHVVLRDWIGEIVARRGTAPLCVEVGTWCGLTAVAMAQAGALVVCVDPFTGADDQTRGRVTVLGGATLERFVANAWLGAVAARLLTVVGRSPEVAGLFADETFDLVFLDGDHEERAVQADGLAWWPKVRPGGILCGHDASQTQVTRALVEVARALGVAVRGGLPDQLWRIDKL